MACAIVVGAVALIRSKYPKMPAYEVVHRLTATAIDRGAPGRDDLYGYGLLNLGAALNADVPPTPSPTPWIKHSASPSAAPRATTGAQPAPKSRNTARLVALGLAGVVFVVFVGGLLLALRRRRRPG